MTFDRRRMIAKFGDLGAERAQSFLSIGIEIGFVETEERVGADIEAMLTSGILALDGVADGLGDGDFSGDDEDVGCAPPTPTTIELL